MISEPLYLECSCHTPEHLLKIYVDQWDLLEPSLVILSQLNHLMPWYKRVWYGLKYIFNSKGVYGHWEETLLSPEDGDKLVNFLNKNWPKAM